MSSYARPSVPSTRAGHKRKIFEIIQHLLAVSLSYTLIWGDKAQGVLEQDFVDWVEDVLKSLPPTETLIPEAMASMVEKILKRSNEYEVQVVEYIDASKVAPAPAMMERADGTFKQIEQVKIPVPRRLARHAKFEFTGNTARFLPTTNPMIVTFIPDPPGAPHAPVEPGMSFEVLTSGKIIELDAPYCSKEQDLSTLRKLSTPPHIPHLPVSCKSSAVQTDAVVPSSFDHAFQFSAPANGSIPSISSSRGNTHGVTDGLPSPSPAGRNPRKQKRGKNTTTTFIGPSNDADTNLVPFPVMGPPTTTPASVSGDVIQGPSTTRRSIRLSTREARSRSSSVSASASTAVAPPPLPCTTRSVSLKRGKKRAREEEGGQEEPTRPTRRLRSDSAKSDSRLSHKVSGMKDAVLKFAAGVFKS